MPKQKLLILGAGALILMILSIALFLLDGEQQVIQSDDLSNNTETSNQEAASTETNSEQTDAGNTINIESENSSTTESIDEETEEELRERAQNTLDDYLPEEHDSFSREAFEEHATAYLHFQQQDEDGTIEEDSIASNAEWIAIEMNGWYTYAQDQYNFNYSENTFEAYVEEEQQHPLGNDAEVRIFIEEMEQENPAVAQQHREYHFAQSYIWHEIQEDAAAEADVSPQSVEQWNQLYYAVEQEVFERISEDHPELLEGEPE